MKKSEQEGKETKKERKKKVHLHFSQLIYFQKYKMGINAGRFENSTMAFLHT